MKNKIMIYIEKIKPWLKTKKAWVQLGLSFVAVICLILAAVSSCSRNQYIEEPIESIDIVTETPTDKPTDEPVVTTTPEVTVLPTATPEATEIASDTTPNYSSDSVIEEGGPKAPEKDITNKVEIGPTGAPLYTPIPKENVDTQIEAYRTAVSSCWGNKNYSSYCLYDMDSDGVEELILHYGVDDMEAYIDIYTYTEDGLVFVGDVTGCFANIAGSTDGGIIVYYRRDIEGQCYETIDRLEKNGTDVFVNSIVVSEKVDTYTVLDSTVDIPSYRFDDLSPLN